MANPTTAAEMPALKPCPFCGDLMEWWGEDMIRHRESGECPLGMMGFVAQHIPAWNRRPIPSDDEMVEKVARAIKESLGAAMGARPLHGDASSGDWHAEPSGVIDLTDVARAAIAAMRGEP